MMLEVITKHFEHNFKKRKVIFVSFEFFGVLSIPNTQNLSVNAPYYVIKQVRKKSH